MRTRLRGLEIAGIQIGIEVTDAYQWEWPDTEISEFACLPRDPEVHVGLRVTDFSSADLGGERYGIGAWTFEVAACGGDWLLGLSRRGVREELARFDADFENGEILISQDAARAGRFPVWSPLDEWIVLHRTVARGGLVLSGSATSEGDHARVRFGAEASQVPLSDGWSTHRRSLLGKGSVVLREEGGLVRDFLTPWNDLRDPMLGVAAPVSDLVVVEESERPFRECLDPDEAAELLVAHSVVPLCDERLFDRVLDNARRMSTHTKMLRIGEAPEMAPLMPWQSAQFQQGFAPPNLAF